MKYETAMFVVRGESMYLVILKFHFEGGFTSSLPYA